MRLLPFSKNDRVDFKIFFVHFFSNLNSETLFALKVYTEAPNL
jgi:hypothetical protein